MFRSVLFAGLALPWPLLVAFGANPLLERAESLGKALGQFTAEAEPPAPVALAPLSPEEQPKPLESEELEAAWAQEKGTQATPGNAAKAKPKGKKPDKASSTLETPKHGIRVGQASVLRLARAKAIPGSAFVAATAERPAGLRLSGVAGLGIGMQEGDVLTHVAGTPVTDRGQVVNLVLQARARRATGISARFHRGGEAWMLVVELPYLEPKSPQSAGTSTEPHANEKAR